MFQKVRFGPEKARETLIEVKVNEEVNKRVNQHLGSKGRKTLSIIPNNGLITITYPMISLHFFHFFFQFGKSWSITWVFLPA